MNYQIVHINETDSTNHWLKEHSSENDVVVWTNFQTAGRGCGTNSWESEPHKNLLFSVLIHPKNILAKHQFVISMAIALGIRDALTPYIKDVSIKWPNDIYWQDQKLCGILIENSLNGSNIHECIIGVGLNVNQQTFRSDAPNPVSLKQITGEVYSREALLSSILNSFAKRMNDYCEQAAKGESTEALNALLWSYTEGLYWREGLHSYRDNTGIFKAELETIEESGHLVLKDQTGLLRRYAFKEVQFCNHSNWSEEKK